MTDERERHDKANITELRGDLRAIDIKRAVLESRNEMEVR